MTQQQTAVADDLAADVALDIQAWRHALNPSVARLLDRYSDPAPALTPGPESALQRLFEAQIAFANALPNPAAWFGPPGAEPSILSRYTDVATAWATLWFPRN
ncbi:MAG: hypothetical protein HYX53_12940 [Chloroflexi bacterium]|nr:hypothetical protein [Chloroflexota bacterium]